ncbi:MAG: UMP kinase, partial [Planctomycetota bacterium]
MGGSLGTPQTRLASFGRQIRLAAWGKPEGRAHGQPARISGRPRHLQTFKRVLLKLSGESFCAPGGFGVDPEELELIAKEVVDAASVGAQVAVVVGGGNIIRGAALAAEGHIQQATADYMGMLGTLINGLALGEKLKALGQESRVMSAIEVRAVAEPFIRGRAIRHMELGRVVVLAAGTGNPVFTADAGAAHRA